MNTFKLYLFLSIKRLFFKKAGLRAILVSDSDLQFERYGYYLRKMDISYTRAYNSYEVLKAYTTHKPDILIIELSTGIMSYFNVIQTIRQENISFPVVGISTIDRCLIRSTLNMLDVHYLQKPVCQSDFISKIGFALTYGKSNSLQYNEFKVHAL